MSAFTLIVLVAAQVQAQSHVQSQVQSTDWPVYGGDAAGHRYSALAQISAANVGSLKPAWVYRTGDLLRRYGRFEATPILVDGTLYVSSPLGRVSALDPETGAERWTYDPMVDLHGSYGDFANRGVSTWRDAAAAPGAVCRRRIYIGTVDARLIALDGVTGRPCDDFGSHGTVDLTHDLLNAPMELGEYEVTSPPAVVGGLVIVGSSVGDNNRLDAPNGVVRAYDAKTGSERWSWDPIPRTPGAPGYDTWRGTYAHQTGAANAWSVLSADTARDLVFVPVGSASPDFYGGERLGTNQYSSSVVALRASTGQVVWAFQVVHHDLWDYDVPAQPVAFTLHLKGKDVAAIAVATKMGHLFILDRTNGQPLVPVEERPVPASDVPGEVASPTQPFPPAAYRFVAESLPASDAFGTSPESKEKCRAWIASLRSEGIFTPSSLRGTIHYPGHIGGFNWSGVAIDERDGLLVAPINKLAMVVTLIPRDSIRAVRRAHPGVEINGERGTAYGMMRQTLLGSDGLPCTPPPFGELVAFDLTRGAVRWRVPYGYLRGMADAPGGKAMGSVSLGGVLVTAGHLVFGSGTLDEHIRAFDLATGRELWSAALPAAGHALPMTYMSGGRQYVVVAAGGHDRLGPDRLADQLIAFALPGRGDPGLDTLPRPLAGQWTGELRISDSDRHPTTLTLGQAGDSLIGDVAADDGQITGPIVAHMRGTAFTFSLTFAFAAKHCGGTITGSGAQANGGTLLEGELQVESTCADGPEAGIFSLRRVAR
ncbi:MAG TPA: pyrroloquinoline quinone-dependent dehydrogenase [Gemmatimonadales bacterium]|nr:pyrroloquinoline quinone-dependent dehydrogenase [Gemmatimonadales bacterium]